LGLVPFPALAVTILLNNTILSLILSPILLHLLYPRMKGWGLLYEGERGGKRLLLIFLLIFLLTGIFLGSWLSIKGRSVSLPLLPFFLSCFLLLFI
jgi:high-affinity Fe2+/Pb2+ permease